MEAEARAHEALASQSVGKAALDHIIAAVELYLQAVAEAKTAADRSRLRKKCQQLMELGERLKAVAPTRPAQPTRQTTLAEAALEEHVSLLSIDHESIEQPARELSKKEQIILLRASRLHGALFPPWECDPLPDEFLLGPDSRLFEDDCRFSMSPQQSQVFDDWKRPDDLFSETAASTDRFMLAEKEPDLVQDITTDCSVVASLCAIVQHQSRWHSPLLRHMMHPYDGPGDRPHVSANGKYFFRMYFNGTFRRVVIDNRLPASESRTLYVVDRQNPALLWPALLEKAYLKVHGGYDFPGSNSGTDLWILTGWIPEQIFIQNHEDEDTQPDVVWMRIKNAYDRGDAMLTLGTGNLSAAEEALLGLASDHDYAVLDMQEDTTSGSRNRRMLVKNPWCDNLVWRGTTPVAPSLPSSSPSRGSEASQTSVPTAAPLTGTFWISYEDIVQYYETLYINWSPRLFSHAQHHHFSWTLPSRAMAHSLDDNPQYTLEPTADGPVWILLSRHFQDADLDRARQHHRQKRPSSPSFVSPSSSLSSPPSPPSPQSLQSPGFIALYVFADTDGHRVQLPDRPRWLQRVPLVDTPQTLLRLSQARRGSRYTVVAAQSQLPAPSPSFTLSFFTAAAPVHVSAAPDPLAQHRIEVSDEWSLETAGGSAASPNFVRNPQYALIVPAPTPLSLLLCADSGGSGSSGGDSSDTASDSAHGREDVPIRVDLVWSRGRRVASLAVRDLVVSSGEYRRGCALAVVGSSSSSSSSTTTVTTGEPKDSNLVEPGTYTVVVSTFEPGQHARFTLRVGSTVPVQLQPIPSEDAGKLRTTLVVPMADDDGDLERVDRDRLDRLDRLDRQDHESNFYRQAVLVPPRLHTRISLIVQAVETRQRRMPGEAAEASGPPGGSFGSFGSAASSASAAPLYTATAAAAAAASTTAVRVSVERAVGHAGSGHGRHSRYEVLAATGDGQFLAMPVAGLRTEEISLGRGTAASVAEVLPRYRIVVEARRGGRRQLENMGIRIDVLSSDRIQVYPWQDR